MISSCDYMRYVNLRPEESYLLEYFRKQLIARTQLIIRYFPIELPSVGT